MNKQFVTTSFSGWREARNPAVFAGLLALVLSSSSLQAQIFFQEDFENPLPQAKSGQPVWSWPDKWTPGDGGGAMPYGPGDFYDRSNAIAHRGSFSMHLNYDGRNDFGNRCLDNGSANRRQLTDNSTVFIDSVGKDLTDEDPSGAEPGSLVWNVDAGYEQWEVASVDTTNSANDTLTFTGGAPTAAGMGSFGKGDFDADDDVRVGRICPDGERRSDVNIVENNLNGHIDAHFPPGGSLFARLYFYIPSATEMPGVTQKLIRFSPADGPTETCSINVDRNVIGCCGAAGPSLQRNTWYYLEMQTRATSSPGASDGVCRVWFAESGEIDVQPFQTLTNQPYAGTKPAKLITIGANYQHNDDAHGFIYLDDIVVADERVGPLPAVDAPKSIPASNITVEEE